MKKLCLALLSVTALSAPFTLGATTLVDTLDEQDDSTQQVSWMVGNTGHGSSYTPFAAFVAPVSGLVGEATVPLQYVQGTVGEVNFELRADDNGQPGELLGSVLGTFTAKGGLTSVDFAGKAGVTQGSTYWFGLSAVAADTLIGWTLNSIGADRAVTLGDASDGVSSWIVQGAHQGAFQLSTISPVPDPATWTLMLTGLGVLAVKRRRQTRRG